jgi:hypothetical protein
MSIQGMRRPALAFLASALFLAATPASQAGEERPIHKPLTAEAENELSKMPADEGLDWLRMRLIEAAFPDEATTVATWPKAYRQLFLLNLFEGEVLNGGLHQFFFNSTGDFAPQIALTLREVGMTNYAEAVEKGMAMFPQPYPVDLGARRRYFSPNATKTTDWDRGLDALTPDVEDSAINAAMLAIAKREGLLRE